MTNISAVVCFSTLFLTLWFCLFSLLLCLCLAVLCLLDTSNQQDWCYLNEDGELGLAYQGLKQVARSSSSAFLNFLFFYTETGRSIESLPGDWKPGHQTLDSLCPVSFCSELYLHHEMWRACCISSHSSSREESVFVSCLIFHFKHADALFRCKVTAKLISVLFQTHHLGQLWHLVSVTSCLLSLLLMIMVFR